MSGDCVNPKHVYLDQNKWIDLARAERGVPASRDHAIALEKLKAAAESGVARFPLSAIHCIETWRTGDPRRRADVAATMMALSSRVAVAPISELLFPEAECAFHACGAFSHRPSPAVPFGIGIAFACGFDEEVDLDADDPEQARVVELVALAAGDVTRDLMNATAERWRTADRYVDAETRHAAKFRRALEDYGRDRTLVTLGLQVSEKELISASIANDVPVEFIGDLGTDGVLALLSSMPAAWTLTQMRAFQLENAQRRWEQRDLNDVKALSVAGAYCDVVAAEKHWTHILRRTDAGKRLQACITSIIELAELLG